MNALAIAAKATAPATTAVATACFRRLSDVAMVLAVAPLSVVGGVWLMWLLGYKLSIGVAVGFIALAGLAAEVCILMLVYLDQAWEERRCKLDKPSREDLRGAIVEGALRRIRPITMTQATVFLGLLPMMLISGTGSEVMQRIAAPMVGGVFAVWLSTLLVLPAMFYLWHGRGLPASSNATIRPRPGGRIRP